MNVKHGTHNSLIFRKFIHFRFQDEKLNLIITYLISENFKQAESKLVTTIEIIDYILRVKSFYGKKIESKKSKNCRIQNCIVKNLIVNFSTPNPQQEKEKIVMLYSINI